MHKQCSTFKNVLNLRYLFFVMYLIFQKIKVMIIFKHLFVISIPSKTLATSSQYVRKLAIFALLIEGRGITMGEIHFRETQSWTRRVRSNEVSSSLGTIKGQKCVRDLEIGLAS